MGYLTYEDQRVPLVTKPMFAEIEWVEGLARKNFEDMSGVAKMRALALISMKRSGMHITWDESGRLSPSDIHDDDEDQADTEQGDAGPTVPPDPVDMPPADPSPPPAEATPGTVPGPALTSGPSTGPALPTIST